MKKLFILVIVYMMTFGCAGVSLKPVANDCINKADYPNSIILQKLENPCVPHKVLVSVSKLGLVLGNYTYEDLHKEIEMQVSRLEKIQSVSAQAVKDVIMAKLLKYNSIAGSAVFVLSDSFLAFSPNATFESEDIAVMVLALKDMDKQAKAMTNLMQ